MCKSFVQRAVHLTWLFKYFTNFKYTITMMSRLTALTDRGIAIVYGDDPMHAHGKFVQMQEPNLGKDYNDFIFFSIDAILGVEINDTGLELPRRGGMDWFWDCVEQVFEYFNISSDILERIKAELE